VELLESRDFEREAANRILNTITSRTKLIMLSHISYGSGAILPVSIISETSHSINPSVRILVDGAHSLGQVPLNVSELGCDFFSSSGTKWLRAPEGTGILYVRLNGLSGQDFKICPTATFQSTDLIRPSALDVLTALEGNICPINSALSEELGTSNISTMVSMNVALANYLRIGPARVQSRAMALAQLTKDSLNNFSSIRVLYGSRMSTAPGIVCFQVTGMNTYRDYRQFVHELEEKHSVICRAVPKPLCIRLSVHCFNTKQDIKQMVEGIKETLSEQAIPNRSRQF